MEDLHILEERKEVIEHQQMLNDILTVLNTIPGQRVFKYLFKHFEVTELPELGFTGDLLLDRLGSLRPGRALFRVVAEADPKKAAMLLAEIENEKIIKEKADDNIKV